MCRLAGLSLQPGDNAGQGGSFVSGRESTREKSMMHSGENSMNQLEQ